MKAFPSLYVHFNKTDEMSEPRLVADSHHGMELRDYFAAKVMQGMCANPNENFVDCSAIGLAEMAYMHADAMLKVRAK